MHSAYLFVFDADINWYPKLLLWGAIGIVVVGAMGVIVSDKLGHITRWRRIGFGLLAIAGLGIIALFSTVLMLRLGPTNPIKVQTENMNANLKQKYDLTMVQSGEKIYPDEYLTHPNKYDLSLPDGNTGTYYIRWDKATNEPTILDNPAIPSPQELNQRANKH